MGDALTIRPVTEDDERVWRELWNAYLAFYETSLPERGSDSTWRRIMEDEPTFQSIVAERDDEIVGFATIVVHAFTWSDRPAGLLHDLFVRPEVRGGGIGRALIEHVISQGRREGWNRVYWMTREDNELARRLYDTYAPADGFVRYRVALEGNGNA